MRSISGVNYSLELSEFRKRIQGRTFTGILMHYTLPTAEKNSSRSRGRTRCESCMQKTVRASRSSGVSSGRAFLTGVGERPPRPWRESRGRSLLDLGLRDLLRESLGLRDLFRESLGLRERPPLLPSLLRLLRRSLRSRLRLRCRSVRPLLRSLSRRSLSFSRSLSLSFSRSLSLSFSRSLSLSFSRSFSLSTFLSFESLLPIRVLITQYQSKCGH